MRIRVSDKSLGECVINVHTDIGKSEEYTIKSLCMLQLMCMNKQDSPEKFKDFISILKKAVDDIEKVYGDEEPSKDSDPTSQFGD